MRSEFADGWRHVREDRRRHLAAALALTVGVALLSGTLLASRSIEAQLGAQAQSLGGLGDVGVVPEVTGTTLAAADGERVADLPGVALAVPTFSSRTAVRRVPGDEATSLVVTGYPAELGGRLPGLRVDGRLPVAGGAEVAVPDEVASDLGVRTGDTLEIATAGAPRRLEVVGVIESASLGALAIDNVFVDLALAQQAFAEPDRLTRVDLLLTTGTDGGAWAVRNAQDLPTGSQVQDTAALSAAAAPLLATLTAVLVGASGATLVVASLLAASAYGQTFLARRRTFGVLRAVGAPRGWLRRAVVAEVAIVAVPCAVVGVLLGILVGRGLETFLASAGNLPAGAGDVAPWVLVVGVLVGVGAALVGAAGPVRRAVEAEPVLGLRGEDRAPGARRRWWRPVTAVLLLAGAVALTTLADPAPLPRLGGALGALVAAYLLAPATLRVVARSGGRGWTARLARERTARDHAFGAVAATSAVVVALGVGLTVAAASVGAATVRQISAQFGADVQVSVPVPLVTDDVTERIAEVADVELLTSTTTADAQVRAPAGDRSVSLLAVDPAGYFAVADLPWVGPDGAPELAAGGSVVLPVALARDLGLATGDAVVLEREGNEVELAVAGTYASLATGLQVVVDRDAAGVLGVAGSRQWFARAGPGASVTDVRDDVAEALADVPGVSAVTAADMRARAERELGTYSSAVLGVVVLMLVLGAVGSAGVLALAVRARSRELAVLRAAGAPSRDLRAGVLWEGVLVATCAVVVGVPVGALAGVLLTGVVGSALRTAVEPVVPGWPLGAVVLLTFAAMTLAALGPARTASRVDPVVAMRAA